MGVMLDLETLGTKPGSIILSIGACTMDGRFTYHQLLKLDEQVNRGMTLDPSTVLWWMAQSDAAREAQTETKRPVSNRMHPSAALSAFKLWFAEHGGNGEIWGHGSNFDIPLIEALFRAFDITHPWKYNAVRDTRTVFALVGKKMGDFGTPNPLAHDALSDAIYQAAETNLCLELINNALRTAGAL